MCRRGQAGSGEALLPTRLCILQKLMLRTGAGSLPSGSPSRSLPSQRLSPRKLSFPPCRYVCHAPQRPGLCWASIVPCAWQLENQCRNSVHTGARMHLPAGIFLQTKEESKKSRSCGGVRELAPMITAGHWYRDCDDEASPSNPSPAKCLHSPSHKDILPHRGSPSWGSQQDPGGQDLPSPLKFCHAHCEARTVLGKRTVLGRDEGPRAHGPGG